MADEQSAPLEAMVSQDAFPEISKQRYYELVTQAHEVAAGDDFDTAGFVGNSLEKFEEFDTAASGNSNSQERLELMVLTAEVLGNRLSHLDHLDSVDAYEEFKTSLQALSTKQRAYCRTCISSSVHSSAQVLPEKENLSAAHIDAQLMAILA